MSLWISSSMHLTNPSSETSWKAIWIALVIFYIPICICKASSIHPSSYHRRKAKQSRVAQSCLLCDPMDCSLPSPSNHGIFQARILEWVAISFSSHRRKGHTMHKKKSLAVSWSSTQFSIVPDLQFMDTYMNFLSFFFDLAPWHVGILFPSQGLNPHPLHWKRGVFTTGPPEKSHTFFIFSFFIHTFFKSINFLISVSFIKIMYKALW